MQLKKIREDRGFTQSQIARLLEIDQNAYARIERTGKCNLQTAYCIAKLLDKTIEELFFNETNVKIIINNK